MDIYDNNNATMIQYSSVNDQMQQQQEKQIKKKKCRGNRKKQRYRRELYAKGLNSEDVGKLVEEKFDALQPSKQQQQQNHKSSMDNKEYRKTKLENKRKRQDLNHNEDGIHMNQSFSQLSLLQNDLKKKKHMKTNNPQSTNNDNDDNAITMNYLQKSKPHYLKVSNKIFKQMLSNAIKNDNDRIIMIQALDTQEKLQLIRQITEITNNLYYFKLQRQLWQDYYNIGLKQDGSWSIAPRLSKSFAKQHHTCRTYGYSKRMIEQRQTTIEHQLQRTTNELNQHLIQLHTLTDQWRPSIDPNLLCDIINECVKNGQQKLCQEISYRRNMLKFDSDDHHLITKFYDLQPNNEQIQLAKMIWETTANELQTKEYEEILRKRIYLRRLPSAIDKTINQSIDPIQLLLSNPMINKDRRASLISSCSKTITQYKFDLMILNLDTIQNIASGHQQLLTDLQEKLLQSNWIDSLKQIVINRQEAMRKRHEIYLKYKLNTFFDEAPMAATSNE